MDCASRSSSVYRYRPFMADGAERMVAAFVRWHEPDKSRGLSPDLSSLRQLTEWLCPRYSVCQTECAWNATHKLK